MLFPKLVMTHRMHGKFRLRFQMPFSVWSHLVVDMKESPIFESWHDGKTNCAGKKSSPLELLSSHEIQFEIIYITPFIRFRLIKSLIRRFIDRSIDRSKTFWIVQIFNFLPEVESETKHVQPCISH